VFINTEQNHNFTYRVQVLLLSSYSFSPQMLVHKQYHYALMKL